MGTASKATAPERELRSARDEETERRLPLALSVVVPTRDRPRMLDEALASLKASLSAKDELIVADSASTDIRVREVAARHDARYVRCAVPGTSRARNAGSAISSSDLIAFVDDDCVVDPGWASAVRSAFAANADVGFLAGALLPMRQGDRVARSPHLAKRPGARLSLSVSTDTGRLSVGPIEASEPSQKNACTRADVDLFAQAAHGANMAWRRSLLEELGGFDERMGPGSPLLAAEDKDAFLRALLAGARGLFEPAALAYHLQWRTLNKQLRAYFAYGVGDAALERKLSTMAQRQPNGRATMTLRLGSLVARCAKDALEALTIGYESAFLAECARLGGALAGCFSSLHFRIEAGHFVEKVTS